jgi:hypothetical protein
MTIAHDAHPSEDHDDTVEAQFSGLERLRPCACMDGWVFLGRVVESEHDLDSEVVEYERSRDGHDRRARYALEKHDASSLESVLPTTPRHNERRRI